MTKAIVLLSGGQDSTTSLYLARVLFDDVVAVTVRYGQRHAQELVAARQIARLAGVRQVDHQLAMIGGSALLDSTGATPLLAEGGIPDVAMPQGLPTSFVAGRNLMLLAAAAAVAVQEGARDLVTGVCQTDYSGYPDCRREFIDSMERTLTLAMPSSAGPFRIHTPLMYMTKAETVRMAARFAGCWEALALTVTCYEGERPGCGACPACTLRARGFAEAGMVDPAIDPLAHASSGRETDPDEHGA